MKIAFLGTSHASQHLSRAAHDKGFPLVGPADADLIFVSEDTPTNERGVRDLDVIRQFVRQAQEYGKPIVLTSAVPPKFTRGLGIDIYHQAETLRIRDAAERAAHPEMLIVGCKDPSAPIAEPYRKYLNAWGCPVLKMTWEEAEFAKVAINCFLAAQVECTNELAQAAQRIGASWDVIAKVLKHDRRIGRHAYTEPGDWKASRHLVRDMRTLLEICS